HTAYLPGRLAWLRRTEPDMFERVAAWMDMGTYLYRCWFGWDVPGSYSVASWSGMLNRAGMDWSRRWTDALRISEAALPALADFDDTVSGLTPDYAERWPALRDVPFCLAVGDGAAANVGSGCVDAGHVALTVGTSAALRVISDDILPSVPEGLWGYRLDAAHHLIGGALTEGGGLVEWLRTTLRIPDLSVLEPELAGREADSHGLTMLPLFGGERSPGWWPDAAGMIGGLRFSTTPLDVVQAALESVALRLSLVYDQLREIAGETPMVMAGGGALAASSVWAQIIANALDCPLHLTAEQEITARGVAILALRAAGRISLDAYPPAIRAVVEPQPRAVIALQAARDRQTDLYRRITASPPSIDR
ncbi:MAG: carbohydrate kinase, partial [Anaerolineae bacterium]|nr:carbohydrate kinase [Anaerolineae bacterium]